MNVFSVNYQEFNNLIEQGQQIDKPCEKIELLKEIKEYFENQEDWQQLPLWLSVRIEKVINHNKTN